MDEAEAEISRFLAQSLSVHFEANEVENKISLRDERDGDFIIGVSQRSQNIEIGRELAPELFVEWR